MSFFDDPYKHKKWKPWLRKFEVGEEQVKQPTEEDMKRIRVAISKLREEELYFVTTSHEGDFAVKRITFDEWMDLPKRRF